MKKIIIFFTTFLFSNIIIYSQNIQQLCPPNWWTGMENPSLQIMIHGKNIAEYQVKLNYPGVVLESVSSVENKNYLFLNLHISNQAKPGSLPFIFSSGKKSFTQNYALNERIKRTSSYGLDASDFIYLLMPDRFSNGDTTNDINTFMLEKNYGRDKLAGRHGGDLQGIINHLEYLKNLGVTATWCTPLLENNQPAYSYHGYAATDHYNIDDRFGSNELFKKYVEKSHALKLKVVMDIVHNHCGLMHWVIQDLPMQDWIHQFPEFTRTNYSTYSLMDPYASNAEKNLMSNGWFDTQMPDLNQSNPFVANYLIQNTIWWIEFAQIDGIRLDTYPYSDLQFLIQWKQALDLEYPGFGVFGEVWVNDVSVQSYFAGNSKLNTGYNSLLNGMTDFSLYYATLRALKEPFGWDTGIAALYVKLTQDYVYNHPELNAIFLGNHDLNRIYSELGEDLDKLKMATAFLLTTRGIPQWYYGDEILMKNFKEPTDALVREDFPGGWKEDAVNKFEEKNLTGNEKDFFNYVKTLANYRKNSEPITQGKLMHYFPYEGLYVYFRYTDSQCLMVVMNTNKKEMELNTAKYSERMSGYKKAKVILKEKEITDLSKLSIPAMTTEIFELQR